MTDNIYKGSSPYWSKLKEAMCGEVSDYVVGYSTLLDDIKVNYKDFTQDDVLMCTDINDLPDDWRELADACIEAFEIRP